MTKVLNVYFDVFLFHTVQVVADRSQVVPPLNIVTQRQCFDEQNPKVVPFTGRVGIRQNCLVLVASRVRAKCEF